MPKTAMLLLPLACALGAEVHQMTLRQAVDLALKQNPDITLARLDEDKAREGIRLAHAPFTPMVFVGSGLAYSNGFPMSIEGSAPSVIQATATADIFNRQQSLAVAQAKEEAHGAALAVTSKRDEVVYRVASLYLDAEKAGRIGALAAKDAESQQKVLATVEAQVREGRALPLAQKQAEYNVARARQIAESFAGDQASGETALAIALGFPAEDRVQPVPEERPAPVLPGSETQAIQKALGSNIDLRNLQSQIAAKQLEIRSEKAARWPRADLVAQYAMLAKYNNYSEFFNKFQRNNGELGVSFRLPLLAGSAVGAQVAQSQVDINRLRVQLINTRNRLSSDIQESFRDAKKAQTAADVARLDLEVAREQLSVDLAQMQEGRLGLNIVEQARMVENQKWIAFYDAQYTLEKARWNVLRLTGELLPSLEAIP